MTENIEIYNIVCQNTMGLSIGSNVYSGIKNVTFHNCTMNSPSYGIRVKVKPHCEGYVQDIYYRNIVVRFDHLSVFALLALVDSLSTNVTAQST